MVSTQESFAQQIDVPSTQESFAQQVDQVFSEYDAATHGYLNIAVIGGVSSGKSSFLNAFFNYPKSEPRFPVSSKAGVTKDVEFQPLGNHIRILDTPGLQDVDDATSKKTKELLNKKGDVDIGILVIDGAANQHQLENYELLKKVTDYVFVVLNKSDLYAKDVLKEIKAQWREVLKLPPDASIYEVCCKGYDFKDKVIDPITREEKEIPVDEYGVPKTIFGVQLVRDEVFKACFKIGKAAFIAKEIQQKQSAAIAIIAAACATSVGAVAYAIFISFFPPNGVLDMPGIIIIVAYMATTLLIVNYAFSKGLEIEKSKRLDDEFARVNGSLRHTIANLDIRDVGKMGKMNFWTEILSQIEVSLD
jgi:small GTP-binding protein